MSAEVLAHERLEVPAREPFVTGDDLPRADDLVVALGQGLGDLTFPDLGVARPQLMGMPSAVLIR